MNEKERDEILYRLDERTKKVDDHLESLDSRVRRNSQVIGEISEKTNKNTSDIVYIKTGLGGVFALFTALSAKLFDLIRVL